MLTSAVLPILNHLLAQSPGAQERLARHSGAHARLEMGGLALSFAIDEAGHLHATADGEPAVVLRVPGDAPFRMLQQGDAVLREARIEGDARLAETLGQVLRSLRWDAAEDLSRLVGDAPAERLVKGAHEALRTGRELGERFAVSSSEYLADEAAVLVRPDDAATFSTGVDNVRDALARLQKRIEGLERSVLSQ